MDRTQSERQLKLDRLQTDLAYLEEAYRSIVSQFSCSTSDVDRLKLEAELAELDCQIAAIAKELAALQ